MNIRLLLLATTAYSIASKGDQDADFSTLIFSFDGQCLKHNDIDTVSYIKESFRYESDKVHQIIDLVDRYTSDVMNNMRVTHTDSDIRDYTLSEKNNLRRLEVFDLHRRQLGEIKPVVREELLLALIFIVAVEEKHGYKKAVDYFEHLRHGQDDRIRHGQDDHEAKPIISYTVLDKLGLVIAKNRFLGKKLRSLINLMPCIDIKASPNRKRRLSGYLDNEKELRQGTKDYLDYMKKNEVLDIKPDVGSWLPLSVVRENQYAIVPPEPHIITMWHLRGPRARAEYGTAALDGYSNFFSKQGKYVRQDTLPNGTAVTLIELDKAAEDKAFPGMPIAVIDAGWLDVDELKPSLLWNKHIPGCKLDGSVWQNEDGDGCTGWDYANHAPLSPIDDSLENMHGPTIIGIIAAQWNDQGLMGICPGCLIHYLNTYYDDEVDVDILVLALEEIALAELKVLNLSLGGTGFDDLEYQGLLRLSLSGVIIVVGAGNYDCALDTKRRNETACKLEPEDWNLKIMPSGYNIPYVITVGGVSTKGTRVYGSNWGEEVDIWAPGHRLMKYASKDKITLAAGTSMAAAIVSGVIGAVWGAYPELTREEIYSIVLQNTIHAPELEKWGNGKVVSLDKAMEAAHQYLADKDRANGGDGNITPSKLIFNPLSLENTKAILAYRKRVAAEKHRANGGDDKITPPKLSSNPVSSKNTNATTSKPSTFRKWVQDVVRKVKNWFKRFF